MHSEINHFGAFLRSVIEAKSASHPFLDWKVCTIAILLNALISIKNYARSCWRKLIHCLANIERGCWCVLKYFKLKETLVKSYVREKLFQCLKNFESVKTFNAQTEGCRQTRFGRNIAFFILILR